jgi:hypothetical protein
MTTVYRSTGIITAAELFYYLLSLMQGLVAEGNGINRKIAVRGLAAGKGGLRRRLLFFSRPTLLRTTQK